MQDYNEFLAEVLITEEDLKKRVVELAAEVDADYVNEEAPLLLICILRGGMIFLTDLMRHMKVQHQIDFMAVSSYGIGVREASGSVRLTLDLQTDIRGMNVLLVEDIIDSGYTISYVLDYLETRHPKSVQVCALLDKAVRREVEVPIHFTGFKIPNKYVFGYGLDIDEYYRNLPFIGVADPENFDVPD